jgi:GT2 family glycosyltransferase
MISIVVLFYNDPRTTPLCLTALGESVAMSSLHAEFLLIDDHSDPSKKIPEALREFRAKVSGAPVRLIRFRERQHYSRGLAIAMSLVAPGSHVLFVSHDMMVTPHYLQTLLAVAGLDPSFGLVRGVSPYIDGYPELRVAPPLPIRSVRDVHAFGEYIWQYHKLGYIDVPVLTGDSMLITREAINRIGVFDPQFPGYFGDVDYGLRLQRAGLKMVCAKGAWLWHEGAASNRAQAETEGRDQKMVDDERRSEVAAHFEVFRQKWNLSLEDYTGLGKIDWTAMRALPPLAGGEIIPPFAPDPAIIEEL